VFFPVISYFLGTEHAFYILALHYRDSMFFSFLVPISHETRDSIYSDFRLLPRYKWDFWSSGMLRSVYW